MAIEIDEEFWDGLCGKSGFRYEAVIAVCNLRALSLVLWTLDISFLNYIHESPVIHSYPSSELESILPSN
jgi:hypothetical protein